MPVPSNDEGPVQSAVEGPVQSAVEGRSHLHSSPALGRHAGCRRWIGAKVTKVTTPPGRGVEMPVLSESKEVAVPTTFATLVTFATLSRSAAKAGPWRGSSSGRCRSLSRRTHKPASLP